MMAYRRPAAGGSVRGGAARLGAGGDGKRRQRRRTAAPSSSRRRCIPRGSHPSACAWPGARRHCRRAPAPAATHRRRRAPACSRARSPCDGISCAASRRAAPRPTVGGRARARPTPPSGRSGLVLAAAALPRAPAGLHKAGETGRDPSNCLGGPNCGRRQHIAARRGRPPLQCGCVHPPLTLLVHILPFFCAT